MKTLRTILVALALAVTLTVQTATSAAACCTWEGAGGSLTTQNFTWE